MVKLDEDSEVYDLRHHVSPGLAILVNQDEFLGHPEWKRDGSDVDEKKLDSTFRELGFTVKIIKDGTKDDIDKKLKKYSTLDSLADHACLVVVVMTHGNKGGILLAKDESYHVTMIWKHFLECPLLQDKPKFFFFQACRGDSSDLRLKLPNTDARCATGELRLPHRPDVLVAYSTVEERLACRNKELGSFFIQRLCDELPTWRDEDIVSLLTRVTDRVVSDDDVSCQQGQQGLSLGQTPTFVSFLTKKVIFSQDPNKSVEAAEIGSADSNATVAPPATNKDTKPYEWSRRQLPSHAYLFHDSQHEEEAKKFEQILKKDLKFNTERKELPKNGPYQSLLEYARSWDLYHEDCVLVCVLASLEEDFFKIEHLNFPLHEVWQPFFSSNCFNLAGKPKMFFFLDAQKPKQETVAKEIHKVSSQHDALHATVPEQPEQSRYATDHSDALIVRGYGADFLEKLFTAMSTALENSQGMVNILTGVMKTCARTVQEVYQSHFESTLRHRLVIREVKTEAQQTSATSVCLPSQSPNRKPEFKSRSNQLHVFEYQKHVLMLILLQCRSKGMEFNLAADYDKGGKFSSVFLMYRKDDSNPWFNIYIKLKHRSRTDKQLCILEEMSKGKNQKYFKEFVDAHRKIEREKNDKIYCIVYTNCSLTYGKYNEAVEIKENSFKDIKLEFPNIFYENQPKKIIDKKVKQLFEFKENENVETFFQEFLLASNQPNNAELKEKVDTEILNVVGGNKRRSLIAYAIFRIYIDEWLLESQTCEFMDNKGFEDFFNKYIQGIRY